MKAIKSQEFLSRQSITSALPGYLVTGDDGYLTDKVYQAIREVVKLQLHEFETLILYGDELTVSDISDYLDSYSIFSDNRLLVIRNAHRFGEENKNRKNQDRQKLILEIIAAYFSHPEASQVVVLVADSVDGRVAEWKKIKETCQTIDCEAIKYGGEMKAWLEKSLRSHQKTMEPRAKDLFLEKVELDYSTADNELEKLLILVGDRKNVTEQDVHITLPTTRSGTMADFYRALGNRETGKVTDRILDMLNNDWVGLQILSVLLKFFLTLWKIQALRAKHITNQEILTTHLKDLFESQRNDYLAYATKYKPEELTDIFQVLLETDASIKLSKAEPEVLMTLCAVKICQSDA